MLHIHFLFVEIVIGIEILIVTTITFGVFTRNLTLIVIRVILKPARLLINRYSMV